MFVFAVLVVFSAMAQGISLGPLGRASTFVKPGETFEICFETTNTCTELSLFPLDDWFQVEGVPQRVDTIWTLDVRPCQRTDSRYRSEMRWNGGGSADNDCRERLIRGQCVPSARGNPCNDGFDCTTDSCSDETGQCSWEISSTPCDKCHANGNCQPKCKVKGKVHTCGDDGCGGVCGGGDGTCPTGRYCIEGTCGSVAAPGSIALPFEDFPTGDNTPLLFEHDWNIFNDNAVNGTHILFPPCNPRSTAKEVYFKLESPATGMHMDMRLQAASGDPNSIDTILALLKCDSAWQNCDFVGDALGDCSDDATPPGGVGSALSRPLAPGKYLVMVDGFSATQVGPFVLSARFNRDCQPTCDGLFCGDDTCGGDCFLAPPGFEGDCSAGQVCSNGRCAAAGGSCTPDCNGKMCGPDGCGGECGNCAADQLCIRDTGKCKAFQECNHFEPICPKCSRGSYCASDCTCRKLDDPVIDLVVNQELLAASLLLEARVLAPNSCAFTEGCTTGTGPRKLLRFTTDVSNQGTGNFKPPPVELRPDLFEWGQCHSHYHFIGFAEFRLWDVESGTVIGTGSKRSYCMEDSYRRWNSPAFECTPSSSCDSQGVQRGWSDIYPGSLDCQWIDVTDISFETGKYYVVENLCNTGRVFHELSFENNMSFVKFSVDPATLNVTVVDCGTHDWRDPVIDHPCSCPIFHPPYPTAKPECSTPPP